MSKVLFWDFDGTLAHSKSLWANSMHSALLQSHPKTTVTVWDIKSYLSSGFTWDTPYNDYQKLIGDKWWDFMFKHFAFIYTQLGIPKKTAIELSKKVQTIIKHIDNYTLFDDTIATLEACKNKGCKNVILSNNYPDLGEVIKGLNIDSYFDNYVISSQIGYDKPRRELFDYAKNLYTAEDDFIMIGDNVYADIDGGNAAGLTTILVHKDLPSNANYSFATLSQICDII